MPVDKSDAQKAREVQDKPVYRRNCSICVRSFYDSLVGPCPERDGRQVCMYCCRMCENSYQSRLGGWACRVKDQVRKRGKRGTGVPSSGAARHLPPGEGKNGENTKPEPSESGSGLERTTGRNLRAATGGSRDAFRPGRTTA